VPSVTVAGAGMAGLVAAARARELGADVAVLEKSDRPGGSMLLSSGVIWRYRDFDELRRQCPGGDATLQRLVWERLDDALDWLERLGAPVTQAETGNPLTTGRRFDTQALTAALLRAAGDVAFGSGGLPDDGPLVLATGGFQGDEGLVERHIAPAAPLALRANPWSAGDGLRLGLARGGQLSAGMDEFYGRNMADRPWSDDELVGAAQLYGRFARVLNERGEPFFPGPVSWSETDLVQATARQPGARAWYVLAEAALDERVREHTVRDLVEASGTAVAPKELPFAVPADAVVGVRVRAAITHTIGGLRVDERARVVGADDLWAAGVDAGGVSTGGYASGLAQALVLGLAAAEDAAQ
jgi:succinate dehydrogenase/fumarate reductase flavoprotein subunit